MIVCRQEHRRRASSFESAVSSQASFSRVDPPTSRGGVRVIDPRRGRQPPRTAWFSELVQQPPVQARETTVDHPGVQNQGGTAARRLLAHPGIVPCRSFTPLLVVKRPGQDTQREGGDDDRGDHHDDCVRAQRAVAEATADRLLVDEVRDVLRSWRAARHHVDRVERLDDVDRSEQRAELEVAAQVRGSSADGRSRTVSRPMFAASRMSEGWLCRPASMIRQYHRRPLPDEHGDHRRQRVVRDELDRVEPEELEPLVQVLQRATRTSAASRSAPPRPASVGTA